MNLLEFTSYAVQSDEIDTYSALVRNDVARFTDLVRDYISGLLDYVEAEVPQSLLSGSFAPDFVLANRLDLLTSFSDRLREQIGTELTNCIAAFEKAPALHARNKLKRAELFASVSYQIVSRANHGPTLHELLIEPVCRRALGLSTDEVSALLHRVAWAPLYYPETLLQHLRGSPPILPPTQFFYPRAGSVAAVVCALEERVSSMPSVELFRDKLCSLTGSDAGWTVNSLCRGRRLVWGARTGQFADLSGGEDDFSDYRKTSVHVAFVTIHRASFVRRFSTLFVLDPDSPIYRITDQTWAAGGDSDEATCTIEIASATATSWLLEDRSATTCEISDQLVRLGVMDKKDGLTLHAIKYFKDAIVAPTPSNRERALENHRQLSARNPEVDFIGAGAPFGAGSFNDNVAQGLRLARSR